MTQGSPQSVSMEGSPRSSKKPSPKKGPMKAMKSPKEEDSYEPIGTPFRKKRYVKKGMKVAKNGKSSASAKKKGSLKGGLKKAMKGGLNLKDLEDSGPDSSVRKKRCVRRG